MNISCIGEEQAPIFGLMLMIIFFFKENVKERKVSACCFVSDLCPRSGRCLKQIKTSGF